MSYRNFFITINHYTDLEYTTLIDLSARYLCIGKEVGEKSGIPHIHAVVCFDNARSFNAIKKKLPRARIEKLIGTPQQAKTYATKGGDFVEYGIIPQQGKRNDIEKVKDLVQEGNNMRQVIESATNYQTLKIAENLLKYYEKPRDYAPIVKWYWGGTGTGKTSTAYAEFEGQDYYVCMDTAQWWEGYDGQEYIIIDELREDFMKYQQLLKLLDRYQYRIQVKGSSRQFKGRHIIITSAFHPHDLFHFINEDLGQLYRRLEGVYEFRRGAPPRKQVFDVERNTFVFV